MAKVFIQVRLIHETVFITELKLRREFNISSVITYYLVLHQALG